MVFVIIHQYGHLPIWLASIFTLLFISFYALYTAFQGWPFHTGRITGDIIHGVYFYFIFQLFGLFLNIFDHICLLISWSLIAYSQLDTPLRGV